MINNLGPQVQVLGYPVASPTKLQPIVIGAAFTTLGPSNVLWVDGVLGVDATAQRGNQALPFQTIQAAVNAAQTDDTVQLAPQRFLIGASITIPAATIRIAIRGWSVGQFANTSTSTASGGTLVSCATDHAFNLGTNLGLTKCVFVDLSIRTGNAAKAAIFADGSAYASFGFLLIGLFLLNCEISTSGMPLNTKYVVSLVIVASRIGGTVALSIVNSFSITIRSTNSQAMGWTFASDVADPLTAQLQPAVHIEDGSVIGSQSIAGTVTIGGQMRIWVDSTSTIGSLKGSGLTVSAAPVASPGVACCGYMANASVGAIDFRTAGTEIPDTATALVFDFRGSHFYTEGGAQMRNDGLIAASFKVGGAAANAQSVLFDDVVAYAALVLTVDAQINLTARGARMPNATLSTPAATGTILPPSPLKLAPVAVAAAPQPVTYPCRIPAGSTAVQVAYNTDNAGSVPTGVITVPTQLGFSAGLVAAGGGNLYASAIFPG